MNIELVAEKIFEEIKEKIDSSWNQTEIVRFVYLQLGYYLEKNVSFFENDKLEDFRIPDDEFMKIYSENLLHKRTVEKETKYQVICKSAAFFLKYIFDRLGIKSAYVNFSKADEKNIQHWFLVVQCHDEGDLIHQYFLTLAADLPYIKNNLPTSHFATNIIAFDVKSGQRVYDIPNVPWLMTVEKETKNTNGETVTYTEIVHSNLEYDALRVVDRIIGYLNMYDFDEIEKQDIEYVNWYINELRMDTEVYRIFKESFNITENSLNRIIDISDNEIKTFFTSLHALIKKKLDIDLNMSNDADLSDSNMFFKKYLLAILNMYNIDDPDAINETAIDLRNKYIKSKVITGIHKDAIILISKVIALESLFDKIEDYRLLYSKLKEVEKGSDEEKEIIKQLGNVFNFKKIIYSLNLICDYFITSYTRNSPSIPTLYIAQKFLRIFPYVFGCSTNPDVSADSTNFSLQNYSEQKVIIDKFLELFFSEINTKNSRISDYKKKFSAVQNRIRVYPIISKETREYCIGFCIKPLQDENEINYIYIPSKNLLRLYNPLLEYHNFFIVSKSIRESLDPYMNFDNLFLTVASSSIIENGKFFEFQSEYKQEISSGLSKLCLNLDIPYEEICKIYDYNEGYKRLV